MVLGRFCLVAVLACGALGASISPGFSAKDSALTTSGLPVPRYVSLKSDHVNVRAGPTKDNDVAWVYTRSGLPVEITAEFENWRRVRDSEGAEGWVYHSLLSGKRTAAVQLKSKTDLAPLHAKPDGQSAVTAQLQVGVLAYHLALTLAFPYDLNYGEGYVLFDAVRFSRGEPVYVDLQQFPMVRSPYPPVFPLVWSALIPVTGPAVWPGRALSVVSVVSLV